MTAYLKFLTHIKQTAVQKNIRIGIVLEGDTTWQQEIINAVSEQYSQCLFYVGETQSYLTHSKTVHCVGMKKGQRLLGKECDTLIFDYRDVSHISNDFDANSFNAALGTLVGGGLLFILPHQYSNSNFDCWLQDKWQQLVVLNQDVEPDYSQFNSIVQALNDNSKNLNTCFLQQKEAINRVKKVVTGHRKRPLVLTANRGRGKTSSLGLAASELLNDKPRNIVITAPILSAVLPVFTHASSQMNVNYEGNGVLDSSNGGSIRFIAPDELLKKKVECDVLFVDEASAIPIPMLQKMVGLYHRIVFSTTVHGYEGCGRGFTVKFQDWLTQNRPSWNSFHIDEPIRWADGDPLELWSYDAFHLNADLAPLSSSVLQKINKKVKTDDVSLQYLSKNYLFNHPETLKQCFALLVNAHYQTSPNDLLQLLRDDNCNLYAWMEDGHCIGCILGMREGGIDEHTVTLIQTGQRRPKGHLIPVLIANHCSTIEAATQHCLRIMRIAVQPSLQSQGIGSKLLSCLESLALNDFDYLATSFGATAELIKFWSRSDFDIARLGFHCDKASGCHSVVMLKPLTCRSADWINNVISSFQNSLPFFLTGLFRELNPHIVRHLFSFSSTDNLKMRHDNLTLLTHFSNGGNSFFSSQFALQQMVMLIMHKTAPSDLLISAVIQQRSIDECIELYKISGKKQFELAIRMETKQLLEQFTL